MKYIFPLFVCIFLCIQAKGQSLPLRLGISIIPEVSKPLIDESESSNSFRSRITSTGSFGMSAAYPFNDKSGIYTGALYSIKRFSIDASNIFLESNNFAVETIIYETINVGSLLVPFNMYYQIAPNWQLRGGLGFNFLIYESRYRSILNGGDEESELKMNDRNFSPGTLSLQVGLHRQIRNNYFQFDVSPQLWLHTHSGQIPVMANTDYQLSFGLEITAWID